MKALARETTPALAARVAVVMAIALAMVWPATSFAQSAANFYAGKTIRIVVGYGSGSSYDGYARIIAQFAGRHIAGHPNIVVDTMEGAGSLTALNYVANIAPQDGTVIAAVGATLPFGPLLGEPSARFDAQKLDWLPSPGSDTQALTIWHKVPIHNLDEARKTELILASNAVTGTSSLYGRLQAELLGLKIKLVYGFTGGLTDALLATERGEVNGHPSASWSALQMHPDWLRDHKIRLLTYFGGPRNPEIEAYDGAVYADDLVAPGADRQLWDLGTAPSRLGHPYVMGPGVPAARVAIIADAMMATFADPDARRALAERHLELSPLSRDAVGDVIRQTYASSPAVVARLKGLFGARQ